MLSLVPLYLTEADVTGLLTPADAVEAVEASFRRLAEGAVDNRPRERLPIEDGQLAVMACVDRGLGYAGAKTYGWTIAGSSFLVVLFSLGGKLEAVIEADRLGQLRTGAASAVAARFLAKEGATSLGVIGSGWQAESQVACIRAVLPGLERVLVHGRNEKRLAAFCRKHRCVPAESARGAAEQDVVVTVTTSKDPVLRGEWLQDGALVCAVGANDAARRELDNVVIERAAFVCCDSREQAMLESGDLIEPVASGALDWLEVHELHEVVSGEVAGRAAPEDVILFKSNGIAAWDLAMGARAVELARERGVGAAV
jgi:ornithine cyclodeaminase/alanine dehydrogenase-like protein (mu-crystallin family)